MKYLDNLDNQSLSVGDKRLPTFALQQLYLTEISDQIWKIVD
jgi:hypothetical protein